ncbi:MAG: UDP-N-acetylglucosamine 2-epimerase (non-hydrolyzing) [Deltaproteobacteria bacterium]|nr:UDP-N-acetylglucosamine 2-epimerase (non-hydrolyzing) [Deltaproteobacteria bacterium]
MAPHRLTIVLGTRPEAVKMAPVIAGFRADPEAFQVRVLSTGQHRDMLGPILASFGIEPDHDLAVMRPGQTLADMTAAMVQAMVEELQAHRPDLLLVQGDTTSVFSATLAAFYARVPVGHVEAGLRSHDLDNPFPEEANRRLVSVLADIHFAPTESAARELRAENIPAEQIVVTGNTVVDALRHMAAQTETLQTDLDAFLADRRMILVTSHRRESWGPGLERICRAVAAILDEHPDTAAVIPVHANPVVRQIVESVLGGNERVLLLPPVPYLEFVGLMHRAELILTDSGGVQEEAPSFGVPVLVLRSVTERPEAVVCGQARLVGTDPGVIARAAEDILSGSESSQAMRRTGNPFGDGRAAERIVLASKRFLRGEGLLLSSSESFAGSCPGED